MKSASVTNFGAMPCNCETVCENGRETEVFEHSSACKRSRTQDFSSASCDETVNGHHPHRKIFDDDDEIMMNNEVRSDDGVRYLAFCFFFI